MPHRKSKQKHKTESSRYESSSKLHDETPGADMGNGSDTNISNPAANEGIDHCYPGGRVEIHSSSGSTAGCALLSVSSSRLDAAVSDRMEALTIASDPQGKGTLTSDKTDDLIAPAFLSDHAAQQAVVNEFMGFLALYNAFSAELRNKMDEISKMPSSAPLRHHAAQRHGANELGKLYAIYNAASINLKDRISSLLLPGNDDTLPKEKLLLVLDKTKKDNSDLLQILGNPPALSVKFNVEFKHLAQQAQMTEHGSENLNTVKCHFIVATGNEESNVAPTIITNALPENPMPQSIIGDKLTHQQQVAYHGEAEETIRHIEQKMQPFGIRLPGMTRGAAMPAGTKELADLYWRTLDLKGAIAPPEKLAEEWRECDDGERLDHEEWYECDDGERLDHREKICNKKEKAREHSIIKENAGKIHLLTSENSALSFIDAELVATGNEENKHSVVPTAANTLSEKLVSQSDMGNELAHTRQVDDHGEAESDTIEIIHHIEQEMQSFESRLPEMPRGAMAYWINHFSAAVAGAMPAGTKEWADLYWHAMGLRKDASSFASCTEPAREWYEDISIEKKREYSIIDSERKRNIKAIAERDSIIEENAGKIQSLINENQALKTQLSDPNHRPESSDNGLKNVAKEKKTLQVSCNRTEGEIQEIQKLTSENSVLRHMLSELNKRVSIRDNEFENRIKELGRDLETMTKTNQALQKSNDEGGKSIKMLKDLCLHTRSDMNQRALLQSESETKDSHDVVKETRRGGKKKKAATPTNPDPDTTLEQRIKELESELEMTNKEKKSLQKSYSELEGKIKQQKDAFAQRQDKAANARQKSKNDQKKKLSELERKCKELELLNAKPQEQIVHDTADKAHEGQFQPEGAALGVGEDALWQLNDESNNKEHELQEHLRVAEKERDHAKLRCASLEDKINILGVSLNELKLDNTRLQKELLYAKPIVTFENCKTPWDTPICYVTAEPVNSSHDQAVKKLQNTIALLQKDIKSKTDELDKMKQKTGEMIADLPVINASNRKRKMLEGDYTYVCDVPVKRGKASMEALWNSMLPIDSSAEDINKAHSYDSVVHKPLFIVFGDNCKEGEGEISNDQVIGLAAKLRLENSGYIKLATELRLENSEYKESNALLSSENQTLKKRLELEHSDCTKRYAILSSEKCRLKHECEELRKRCERSDGGLSSVKVGPLQSRGRSIDENMCSYNETYLPADVLASAQPPIEIIHNVTNRKLPVSAATYLEQPPYANNRYTPSEQCQPNSMISAATSTSTSGYSYPARPSAYYQPEHGLPVVVYDDHLHQYARAEQCQPNSTISAATSTSTFANHPVPNMQHVNTAPNQHYQQQSWQFFGPPFPPR